MQQTFLPDRPTFHVMPRKGWLNDPNGPIYHRGRYHIFYQHVEDSATWAWRLTWGHASSPDLVRWEHEPVALRPTPDSHDADGCWSGNVAVGDDGVPTLLYTAVRLRANGSALAPPPEHLDLGLEQFEAQCAARCDPGDPRLTQWTKLPQPVAEHPPGGLGKLTGFRDPFVISRKTDRDPWKIIVGSGIEGRHGTVLLYHAHDLTKEWEFRGPLVRGASKRCEDGADFDLGAMWECPFFVRLPHAGSGAPSDIWMLCVSPYPHHRSDRPTNPCLYWLGAFEGDVFDLEKAAGPRLLDLGDTLYAPTLVAGVAQPLMLAWLQELEREGPFDHAGCLSLPRRLSLEDGRLRQDPAPELAKLRTGRSAEAADIELAPGCLLRLPRLRSDALDAEIAFERGASSAVGVLLRSDRGGGGRPAEALLLTWDEPRLEIVTIHGADPESLTLPSSPRIEKRIGGPVRLPPGGQSLALRLLLDHSVVEAFTETGQALASRVYRHESAAPGDASGLLLFALGGPAVARSAALHEMGSIWAGEGAALPN